MNTALLQASLTIDSLNRTTNKHDNYRHVCGRRSLEHEELMSVRAESMAGDWPWHVALLKKDIYNGFTRYECGGSIISRTTVLTGRFYYYLTTSI